MSLLTLFLMPFYYIDDVSNSHNDYVCRFNLCHLITQYCVYMKTFYQLVIIIVIILILNTMIIKDEQFITILLIVIIIIVLIIIIIIRS